VGEFIACQRLIYRTSVGEFLHTGKVTLAGKNFWRDTGNQIWLKNNFYGQSGQIYWVPLTQTTKREIVIS